MILDIFGVDTNGILASLGIAGVVLGLALQDTVQDLMSGIYIILDNYFVIGDTVRIDNFTGEVVELSLKSTKIKGSNGEIYILANRNIGAVVNLSQSRAGISIKVPTAYEEKTSKVEEALQDVVKEALKIPNVYKDSAYLGIDSFDASAINYAIIIYCKSSDQWAVKRKVLKLIKEMYQYSIPLVPNGISWWIVNVSDRTIITAIIGTAANGIYAVSNKFPTILSSLLGILIVTGTSV